MTIWHYFIHKHLSYKLGFTLYKNQFGPGLYIMHYGTIVVNPACRIGANCNINADVNIGMGGSIIGNDCYISPGVKIVKPVHIGNQVVIGANAVVTKDIPDDSMVVGIPAKIIKRFDHNIQQWLKCKTVVFYLWANNKRFSLISCDFVLVLPRRFLLT